MSRFKSILIALTALILFVPGAALADQHSSGTVTVQVVDQYGHDVAGVWYLYEGSGTQGMISRNGTWGEAFGMNYGTYFLTGEAKTGYDSFAVTGENPQTTVPNANITFTLVYQRTDTTSSSTTVTPPVAPVAPEQPATPPVREPEPPVMTPEAPASTLPPRTPLQVDQPLTSRLSNTGEPVGANVAAVTTQPMQLATTGPEGLAGLMAFSSVLSGLWITRRRKI